MKKVHGSEKRAEEFRHYLITEELSDNTIDSYVKSIEMYFTEFDQIDKVGIISWKNKLLKSNKPATVNLRLCAIRKYIKFIQIEMKIKPVKVQKIISAQNVITLEEYKKIIDYCENSGKVKYALMFTILGNSGARISEALKITYEDVDKGVVEIETKGKFRKIILPQKIKTAISKYTADGVRKGKIFTNKHGEALTSRGLSSILKTYGQKAGIPKEKLHPHSFRHMFAIEFLKRNPNIALLADIMGHSSVNTTAIYLRLSNEDQIDIANKTIDW